VRNANVEFTDFRKHNANNTYLACIPTAASSNWNNNNSSPKETGHFFCQGKQDLKGCARLRLRPNEECWRKRRHQSDTTSCIW